MKATLRANAPRLLAEGVVIVVSVLLALSADAWWSGVQDRSRVHDHVRALARDFEQMAERNAASTQAAVTGAHSGFALVSALGREDFDLLADSAGMWLEAVAQYEAFSPSTGAYDALIASGDLELIPNADLKRALAEFFGSFEDVRVTEQGLRDAQDRFFLSGPFADAWGVHRLLGYPETLSVEPRSPGTVVLRRWASSEAFLNGVTWVTLMHISAVEDYEFLQAEMDRIRPALATYLAGVDS